MSRWKFRMYVKVTAFSFSLLHTVFISDWSSTKELASEILRGAYIVDGRADERNGKNMPDLKDNGLLVGIQNDATNVFVCLMSIDRTTARLMTTAGMIVWIETEHGKRLGVHYPLPMVRSSVVAGVDSYGNTTAIRGSSGLAVLELKIPHTAKHERNGTGIDNTLSINIDSGTIQKPTGWKHQGGGRRHSGSSPVGDIPTEGSSLASNDKVHGGDYSGNG